MVTALLISLAGCSAGDDTAETVTDAPQPSSPVTSAVPGPLAELPVPRTEVAGVTWQGPTPLHHAAMAVVANRAVIVGGYTNGPGQPWVAQAAMFSLGEGEDQWRRDPPLPSPRGAMGAAVAGDLLVVVGGESAGQALTTTVIYAIAGRTTAGENFTVVESLDPVADQAWRAEPALNDSRGGIGAERVDDRVCVAGGEEAAGTIASVECLDGDNWTRAGELNRPRHGLAVMALDGELHVVGGGEQPGLFVSGAHESVQP